MIAERVRHAFAERTASVDGQPLNATVSAGVAEAGAEACLRRHHRRRRPGAVPGKDSSAANRVERADARGPDGRRRDTVIRIA